MFCNFALLCCLLVVWRCWFGLSCSLLELSPAGRGWCLAGDRLFISLLVYFGVVKLNVPCSLFLFVLTGRWPLRCCLALLCHQIERHQFRGVSLDCLFFVVVSLR